MIRIMKKLMNSIYNAPICEVLSIGTQSVICGSETEKVTETNGEW